ncbi:glycoside hydrolase family 1 protein [Candidatus Saccharibacteria bacterium]|nr:MAG: glycoside hydrolase family 1 protein [Candidatus Saccharibacteria bacterium]
MAKNIFPKNFYWGASTASHQVEGGTVNQWTEWELAHASELAKTAKQRLQHVVSDWDSIRSEAEDPNNYVSGKGINHYARYQEDFDLAKKINLSALRFSVEWSRIEPNEGEWDEVAIEHYREYIRQLRARGLEPFLNIWHWTMPNWFIEKGAFEKSSNLRYWRRFVQKIGDEYADELKYILTINEPNVYASFGYLTGEWPPQRKNFFTFGAVYYNLARAHRQAYKILRKKSPTLKIGLAPALANIQAKRPSNLIDVVAVWWMRYFWNWWFINRVKRSMDFVGFNYYFSDYYRAGKLANPEAPRSDLGWYMEPEGLHPLLVRTYAHYKKPIFITENGVADASDQYRQWWLEETTVAMERALSEGVDLRGYFHWSLLDNFEWKYGWWPKFGLIEVDRKQGMKRTIRPSAKWFAKKIASLQDGEKPTKEVL